MPNYKAHLVGGAIAYAIGVLSIKLLKFNPTHQILYYCFATCLLGSLFPDIDTKSKIQKLVYTALSSLLVALLLLGRYKLFGATALIALIPLVVNHRTLFHHPIFLTASTFGTIFPLSIFFPQYSISALYCALFFLIGCFSHLILDIGFRNFLRKLRI